MYFDSHSLFQSFFYEMWSTTSILLALAASANAMVNYEDMIARRTITPAPSQPTDASIVDLERRDNSISLEGYTSEFGTCKSSCCLAILNNAEKS